VTTTLPVRVRLRFPDLDTFVERFAANVTRGGVFIASRSPRPVGDAFPFEVQLASGEIALAGEGKVIWVKEYNPDEPSKPHGMGVQFVSLTPPSRAVLKRMLAAKDTQKAGAAQRPSGLTAPLATLQARANGAPQPRVDTNVDLAAEFGLDEAVLRRALDRAWGPGARPAEDELAGLLAPEPAPAVTLAQVLKELPRMLDRSRSRSGAFRTLESLPTVAVPAGSPAEVAPEVAQEVTKKANGVSNGVSHHAQHSEEHQG
jgi:molecular chaperone DnaK